MLRLMQMGDGNVVALMDFPREDTSRFVFQQRGERPLNDKERQVLEAHKDLFFVFNAGRRVVEQ